MKKCILVLGMHRSGTSLFTGLLNDNGIPVGKQLLEPLEENPRGFFELKDIYYLNEELLKSLNTAWDNVKEIDVFALEKHLLDSFKEKLKIILNANFADEDFFVLKDPRISILFDFYFSVFKNLEIEVVPILVRRDIWEIVKSINKRNSLSLIYSYALTKFYLNSTIKYLNKYKLKYLTIDYSEILKNPKNEIIKVFRELSIPFNYDPNIDLIDPLLHRNKSFGFTKKVFVFLGGELKYFYLKTFN